ncbi:MAG: leucine-rich repeat protein [Oscillospiraceae bacterium]|nr:leucine-rich repeat protein [Oscillospiraceae bacterium]
MRHFKLLSRFAVLALILALCMSVAALADGDEPEPEPDYSTLALGEDNYYRNSQGVIFSLSRVTNTASVGTGSTTANNAGYEGANDGNLIIPDIVTYEGQTYDVTEIQRYAFTNNTWIKTVTLGKNISHIDPASENSTTGLAYTPFSCCPSFTEFKVDSGNSKYRAVDGVLFDASSKHLYCVPGGKTLAKYIIPAGTTIIESGAFCGCWGIGNVVINGSENSYMVIKNYSFCGAYSDVNEKIKGIKTLTITGDVEEISDYAFRYCAALETVTVNTSVDSSIGSYVFADCPALVSVDINGGVKTIGRAAFSNCESLKTLYIYSGVESMGYYPLVGCVSLQKLTLPFLGTTPEKGCFFGNLFFDRDYLYYPEDKTSNETVDTILNNPQMPNSPTVPKTLTDVGIAGGKLYQNAFRACVHIESITLGRSITAIPSRVFLGCTSLSKIDLGISENFGKVNHADEGIVKILPHIESIGVFAFYECKQIAAFDVASDNTAYANDYFGVLYNKGFTKLICYPPANECKYYCVKGSTAEIAQSAFSQYCSNLLAVNIPNSSTNLYYYSETNGLNSFNSKLQKTWICVHRSSAAEKALGAGNIRAWTIEREAPTRIYILRLPDTLGFTTGTTPEFSNLQIIVEYPGEASLLLDPLDYDVTFSEDTTKPGACTANIVYKQDSDFAVQFDVFFFAKQTGYVIREFTMRSDLAGALAGLKNPCFITAFYDSNGKLTNVCTGAVIDNTESCNSLRYSVYMPKALSKLVDADGVIDSSDTIKSFILDGMIPRCEPGTTLFPPLENLLAENLPQ